MNEQWMGSLSVSHWVFHSIILSFMELLSSYYRSIPRYHKRSCIDYPRPLCKGHLHNEGSFN
uniref:Uncharacterized protein n=1 Tax=Lepeophtheirus salmonis TaxID=72036 RepID=A0A0K2UPQ3_LEPSM